MKYYCNALLTSSSDNTLPLIPNNISSSSALEKNTQDVASYEVKKESIKDIDTLGFDEGMQTSTFDLFCDMAYNMMEDKWESPYIKPLLFVSFDFYHFLLYFCITSFDGRW